MHIGTVITINWGNIPNDEYAFGTLHLISGETGAGKTTLADAVQTVMTATKSGLYEYNPGQQDATQRGRGGKIPRSLETYILGGDEGSFSRLPAAQGYVAVVFEPDSDEDVRPVTAVVGAVAQLSGEKKNRAGKLMSLMLLVCEGVRLSKFDFYDGEADNRSLIPIDKLYNHLKANYGTGVQEFGDKKGHYLQKLYGAFRGRRQVSDVEARFAAHAFSRFMAYKKIDSIDQFVFDQVLDPPERIVDIARILDMMREGNRLKKEASRMAEAARRLEAVMTHGQSYDETWRALHEADLALAFHLEWQNLLSIEAGHIEMNRQKEQMTEALEEIEFLKEKSAEYGVRRDQINAKLNKYEDYRLRPTLLEQRKSTLRRSKQNLEQFKEANRSARHAVSVLQNLARLALGNLNAGIEEDAFQGWQNEPLDYPALEKAANKIGDAVEISLDLVIEYEAALSNVSSYFPDKAICQAVKDIEATAVEQRGHLQRLVADSKQTIAATRSEIDDIERRGQLKYPAAVSDAIEYIRSKMPEAEPFLLCELIEVKDVSWQGAIEGYIGENRFNLVVNEGFEKHVFESLAEAGVGKGTKVIDAHKALCNADMVAVSAQSIVTELQCLQPVALAYLKLQFGGVLKVNKNESLFEQRRALTKQGHAVDGYTLFLCNVEDGELVFGQYARKRRLVTLQGKLIELEKALEGIQGQLATTLQLLSLVREFTAPELDSALAVLRANAEELAGIDQSLSLLDLSGTEPLFREFEELETLIKKNNDEIGKLGIIAGNHEESVKSAERMIDGLQSQCRRFEADREAATEMLSRIAEYDHYLNLAEVVRNAEALAKSKQVIAKDIERKRDDAYGRISPIRTGLSNAIGNYNSGGGQFTPPSERIDINAVLFNGERDRSWTLYLEIRKILASARHIYKRIKETHLPDAELQIKQASHELNKAFTRDLCQIIVNDIKEGEQRLTNLSNSLAGKRFGGTDTFKFEGRWRPEFKSYHDFFQEVLRLPAESPNGDLFAIDVLSEEAAQTRDKLFQDLWAEDFSKAKAKLEELGDYRNYKTYEIYKLIEGAEALALSKYGTGSGGQAETPAYLIRAAAYSSAFQFSEPGPHLKTVFLDEAFGKVDEPRTREILDYLARDQQLQVVFIMPTRSCAPFLDVVDSHYECVKVLAERPRGELKTKVLIQRGKYNNEKIRQLWSTRKTEVRQMAIREFEATELGESIDA